MKYGGIRRAPTTSLARDRWDLGQLLRVPAAPYVNAAKTAEWQVGHAA